MKGKFATSEKTFFIMAKLADIYTLIGENRLFIKSQRR
jgi:hypothetical protein